MSTKPLFGRRRHLEGADREVGRRPEEECPGCDYPVGYAPHNGRGDCPPRNVENRRQSNG